MPSKQYSLSRYQGYCIQCSENDSSVTLEQGQGKVIFVPSAWHGTIPSTRNNCRFHRLRLRLLRNLMPERKACYGGSECTEAQERVLLSRGGLTYCTSLAHPEGSPFLSERLENPWYCTKSGCAVGTCMVLHLLGVCTFGRCCRTNHSADQAVTSSSKEDERIIVQ